MDWIACMWVLFMKQMTPDHVFLTFLTSAFCRLLDSYLISEQMINPFIETQIPAPYVGRLH